MGYRDQPKWDKKNMMVPFDSKGNLATYYGGTTINWVHVFSFKSKMKIVTWGNTTGSAVFDLEDEKGFVYPIYVSDLLSVLQTRDIHGGTVEESIWTYRKQGRQYSIKLDESETQP